MDAQLIVVFQNGFAEAREPKLRNRFELIDVDKSAHIKSKILENLKRIGRAGALLVKWNSQLYICEMKQNGTYTRVEISYHPHADKFTI
jgi:hypothetical protein